MRTAIVSAAIMMLGWAVGCSTLPGTGPHENTRFGVTGSANSRDLPAPADRTPVQVPQAADVYPPAGPVRSFAEPDPFEVERGLAHGPADPRYQEPAGPGGSPNLAMEFVAPYRMRTWATETARFPNGVFVHMPRWLADPYDDQQMYTAPLCSCRKSDVVAAVYCPLRYAANLIALPVTIFVHPLCETESTDRTPTVGCPEERATGSVTK